eukprot:6069199-Pleurochrysis_carterae.AAC.2
MRRGCLLESRLATSYMHAAACARTSARTRTRTCTCKRVAAWAWKIYSHVTIRAVGSDVICALALELLCDEVARRVLRENSFASARGPRWALCRALAERRA